jgi:hypothetical protein
MTEEVQKKIDELKSYIEEIENSYEYNEITEMEIRDNIVKVTIWKKNTK